MGASVDLRGSCWYDWSSKRRCPSGTHGGHLSDRRTEAATAAWKDSSSLAVEALYTKLTETPSYLYAVYRSSQHNKCELFGGIIRKSTIQGNRKYNQKGLSEGTIRRDYQKGSRGVWGEPPLLTRRRLIPSESERARSPVSTF